MNNDQDGWERPRGRHRSPDAADAGTYGGGALFEPRTAPPDPAYGGVPSRDVTAPYGGQGGYWQAPGDTYWQPPDAGWAQGAGWAPEAYAPPKRRRTGLIVALSVVAVVAVAGALVAVIGVKSDWLRSAAKSPAAKSPAAVPSPVHSSPAPTPQPRSLAVPSSFGDYNRLSGTTGRRAVAEMRKAATRDQKTKAARAAAAKLKIGIYRISGVSKPELFMIGFAAHDSAFFAGELKENSPSSEVDFALLDMKVTHSKRYSPGALGGALRCGKKTEDGVTGTVCAWADDWVAATVLDFRITKPSVLAGVTRSLRAAAEH